MEHKNDLDFNATLYGKKFGFRKLSAGLAAVALITTFFLSNSHLVHADENNASQQTTEVKENAQTVDSDQQNVYSYLTTHPDEQTAFEDYLKAHSNSSDFSVDQSSDGSFHFPSNGQNDTSYSRHAYFIQVDAAVENPRNSPVMNSLHLRNFNR